MIKLFENILCWLGFHNFYTKINNGYFTDNQCTNCGNFKNNLWKY